ncbi:MAG: CocE/NonD family hydrolase [Phycisphaerae bacterium]|nr:CocE/NonD family hydrolase [Phycisphaerae bacterium]
MFPRRCPPRHPRASALLPSLLFLTACATAPPQPPPPAAPAPPAPSAQEAPAADVNPPQYIRQNYTKHEYRIPMRDGVHLFTAVYAPKDTSRRYPFLLMRTPYCIAPYGEAAYPEELGPSSLFPPAGYIFVYQDVRGRFMSEGEFVNMTPHLDRKSGPLDIDESTDTYDTIEWLLHNIPNHNGRAGQWGVSYPGFCAAAGMIDAHPALKAVSPQAPIADWFFDDFHHHGAFFLPDAFNFFASFGQPRPQPTTEWPPEFNHPTPDGYRFFLDLGPLKNVNARYFKREIAFWNDLCTHPNYDEFWQRRNILPHLRHVAPAVMTVGGWFDAEDLYGPLQIYRAIEKQNPGIFNVLVMGPWAHGGWTYSAGDQLGNIHFGAPTAEFYRAQIELPFFNHYLKDQGELQLPEAYVFETGANRWRTFTQWPPANVISRPLYFVADGGLAWSAPSASGRVCDEYVSDPAAPVPFCERTDPDVPQEYMTDDQRFAARRPDVLVYRTPPLTAEVTVAGPIRADLWVSISGTDADWIVKLIDVLPSDAPDNDNTVPGPHPGGYQMHVRSEVFRGRFRNSYAHPEPFVPDEPAHVAFDLQDVLHTFQRGHCIMVQVQSTWFPMVDRNPQTYVDNIFEADEADFIQATHRVYRASDYPTHLQLGVLPAE